MDSNGIGKWTLDGVLLSATGTAETPQIVSDGNSGAIITWHQYITPAGQFDIYSQRIKANGTLGWGNDGVVLCSLASNQMRPQLTSDGDSGAIIVWEDYRNSTSYSNLYAQKVNASGLIQWASNGVNVAPNTLHQIRQKLLSDGSGGAFITWQYGTNEVFAQRINSGGVSQWANDGVSIGSAGDSRYPQIVTDGGTGAIITWYDYRGSGNGDIFAQHLNFGGTVLWVANGVGVCRNSAGQVFPRIVEDGSGGAILAWEDDRNSVSNSTDVYAQKINPDGGLGVATGVNETAIDNSLLIYPHPFTNELSIKGTSEKGEIIILDVMGKECIRLKSFAAETKINTEKLLPGFYFLNSTYGNETANIKMVKF